MSNDTRLSRRDRAALTLALECLREEMTRAPAHRSPRYARDVLGYSIVALPIAHLDWAFGSGDSARIEVER